MALAWQRIEEIDQPVAGSPNLGQWTVTDRAAVFGGWLVRTYMYRHELGAAPGVATTPEYSANASITFIPDPQWQWSV